MIALDFVAERNWRQPMFTKYFFKPAILLASLFVFHFPLPSNAFEVNKIIDDFTDNPEKRWQFHTDQVSSFD